MPEEDTTNYNDNISLHCTRLRVIRGSQPVGETLEYVCTCVAASKAWVQVATGVQTSACVRLVPSLTVQESGGPNARESTIY